MSSAQVILPVQLRCVTADEIHQLLKKYEETPFAIGVTERGEGKSATPGLFMMFVNSTTQSWTLVEETRNVKGEPLYCVLSAGSDFNIFYKSKKGL